MRPSITYQRILNCVVLQQTAGFTASGEPRRTVRRMYRSDRAIGTGKSSVPTESGGWTGGRTPTCIAGTRFCGFGVVARRLKIPPCGTEYHIGET